MKRTHRNISKSDLLTVCLETILHNQEAQCWKNRYVFVKASPAITDLVSQYSRGMWSKISITFSLIFVAGDLIDGRWRYQLSYRPKTFASFNDNRRIALTKSNVIFITTVSNGDNMKWLSCREIEHNICILQINQLQIAHRHIFWGLLSQKLIWVSHPNIS